VVVLSRRAREALRTTIAVIQNQGQFTELTKGREVLKDCRPRLLWRRAAQAALVAVTGMVALAALFALGYISRVKARALSPDGRVEAVCRGWLPEPTEYGVWLRKGWQPWGTHLAQSGSESMGRCRALLWSPDGRLVVVVNEGNSLVVLDAEASRRLAFLHPVAPGEGWDYASKRIITSARFVSADMLEFEHCDRGQTIADDGQDFSRCGMDRRVDSARLLRTSSGDSVKLVADGNTAR
jgi:hypothetical protein